MTTSFEIEAGDGRSLGEAFGERGYDLSHFATRTERKRVGNGLEEELYVLRRYLFTLQADRSLAYPLKLSKSEAPDFVVSAGGDVFGIEVTQATATADQREMTLSERSGQPALLGSFGGRYAGGIRDSASPQRGSRADRDLTSDVLRAVRRKRGLSYKTPNVDLLLYANGNANMMSDHKSFIPLVCSRLDHWSKSIAKRGSFRRIAIIKGSRLIVWDGPGKAKALVLRESAPDQ